MTLTSDISAPPLAEGVGNDYGPSVATTQRKTPQRTLVVEPADWDDLATAAKTAGSERAQVLRAFIRWYIRRPGAKLPPRPGE